MSEEFWQWFDDQRNGIPVREIERRADAPHGRISSAYHRKKEPSAMVCETIAKGLGIDQLEVYRRAGLITPLPAPTEPDSQTMLRDLWRALQSGQLQPQPDHHEPIPPELKTPDPEDIMDLLKRLDPHRQRVVFDFARWQLKEQVDPNNSSGTKITTAKLQDWQKDIELIEFLQSFDEASDEDIVAFKTFLRDRKQAQQRAMTAAAIKKPAI